jgi:small subunit ribosomal protein S17
VAKAVFGNRKTREGVVVSDKMEKTVVVAVSSAVRDRLYKKIVRRQRHYMAHDDENDAKLGDTVRIVEARPHSRNKRWRLAEVLIRADRPEVAPEEIDLELLGEVKPEVEEEEAPAAPEAVAPEPAPEEPAAEEPVPEEVPEVEEAVAAPEAVAEAPEEPPEDQPEAEQPATEEPAPEAEAEAPEEPTAEEQPEADESADEGEEEKDA